MSVDRATGPGLPAPLQVLLVDDHALFRRGLAALLGEQPDMRIVGEAGDVNEALRLAAGLQPDLILLDNHLPGVAGVDAIESLRREAPRARVLMLTVSESADDLRSALRSGAAGYVLKSGAPAELPEAMRRASRGETVIGPGLAGKVMQAFDAGSARPPRPLPDELPAPPAVPAFRSLGERETEVALAIARGASNKRIALDLDMAEATVKAHVRVILRKLGLSSRVQIAVLASRGLLDIPKD